LLSIYVELLIKKFQEINIGIAILVLIIQSFRLDSILNSLKVTYPFEG